VKADGAPYKNMYGLQANLTEQAKIMGSFAVKNGSKRFGVLYNQSNAYSTALLAPFVDQVKKDGGTIIEPVPYNPQDRDFKTLLGKILNQNIDTLFCPNYTQELILISQQARALGFKGALYNGLDACPPFNTLMGEPCDNIYFINNVDDTQPALQSMIKDVKAKTGVDITNKFFLGYDVAKVLAKVFGGAGTEPAAVSAAVEKLTSFSGLTGSITIDPANHMPTGLGMVIFKYENITPVALERYIVK
jgi:branched-chain amino acid transport system substrate-binding protein